MRIIQYLFCIVTAVFAGMSKDWFTVAGCFMLIMAACADAIATAINDRK